MTDFRAGLTALFTGSVVLANVLAAKLTYAELPIIGGAAIPAGFVAFGVAYLASDLLVEYHGREVAHSVVNATIGTLIVTYILIFTAIWMPAAPFWENQPAYEAVLGDSASIVLASVIALGIAQHLDVRLFDRLRSLTAGKHRWLRNCGSTMTSQLADTMVFIGLGFAVFPFLGLGGDATWGWELVTIIIGQYVFKLGVAIADTIPFYIVTEIYPKTARK